MVTVSHLLPLYSSGTLQRGDLVLAINGVSTDPLTHQEVTSLLQNAGNYINLEIAYDTPPGGEGGRGHRAGPGGVEKNRLQCIVNPLKNHYVYE